MGDPNLGEDDARVAAGKAQVLSDINRLPMQFQTLVSELGANFSGGQRQRIALARALIREPRVLILDEATSSLDTFNEARITEHLNDQSCTTVVIAHRLSTIIDADRIYVMDKGRVVQEGTHSELAAQPGLYQELFASSLTPEMVV
ncbi:putative ADP-ribosylation factor GTPase-activating protein AGD11 [Platysternon megacephalum]|uniref:Putative ADP-ribosylation factor GTPase-activating protein AGD11 n=1 Tax=Platysternon megacephalum TaxID=55544 RepID=A0A4D9DGE9_9SAUR|nr:putative ADP-ribosylation factor GTPase-activating protein AGD11 [Platysternon megacephalum]